MGRDIFWSEFYEIFKAIQQFRIPAWTFPAKPMLRSTNFQLSLCSISYEFFFLENFLVRYIIYQRPSKLLARTSNKFHIKNHTSPNRPLFSFPNEDYNHKIFKHNRWENEIKRCCFCVCKKVSIYKKKKETKSLKLSIIHSALETMTQTICKRGKMSFEIDRFDGNWNVVRYRCWKIYFAQRMFCVHKKIVIWSDFPNEFVTLMWVED